MWFKPKQDGAKSCRTFIVACCTFAVSLTCTLVFLWLVPSFVKARNTSARNACINNLRQIDSGKEQAALANKWEDGTDCDNPTNKAVINQYIKGNTTPLCPDGGTYSYNLMGKNPTCSKYRKDDVSTRSHHLPDP